LVLAGAAFVFLVLVCALVLARRTSLCAYVSQAGGII
jgi:hypothetical protein